MFKVAVGCLVAIFLANQASAQTWSRGNHPYLGIVTGAYLFDGGEDQFDHNLGYVFGGQIGYTFGSWRSEAEITYASGSVENNNDVEFDTTAIRGAIGLYYDVTPITSLGGLSPYAGFGIGGANITVEGTRGNNFEDDVTGFTFHGEAGMAFNISPNFALAPHYRFEWFDSGDGEIETIDKNFYAHAFRISSVFTF